jgi:F-type H+-transporting ATPase subunit beta
LVVDMADEQRTTSPRYTAVVERARRGDPDAFAALVESFQDLVVGSAFGWLRDIELAKEVAQETFANAHAALAQLDEPAAFPGWLQRIVRKHCDRVTRRGRLELAAWGSELADDGVRADRALDERRAGERLRRAVEALPAGERLPLVLHYFAGEPLSAIAEFLELPLSTVKKRLRTARERLRRAAGADLEDPTVSETTRVLRPSRDDRFSASVRLHLALRSGDVSEVSRILVRHPELADAEQSWDPSLTFAGVLPFPTRATPLLTAVERDDEAMVRRLLEHGAATDGACGCATGESPLWAAVLLRRPAIARVLLEAGADPNAAAATRSAPLHVAAMRGERELVRLLLAHGADCTLRDAGGRTPAEWARSKGFGEVAALLEASAEVSRAPDVAHAKAGSAFVETGIKGVDLFAPLVPGCLIRVPFRAGVGMVVLMNELSLHFASLPSGAAVWTGFAQGPYDPRDLRADLAEAGLAERVAVHVASREESPEARRATFHAGVERVLALRDEGRTVLVVLLGEPGFEVDVEASFARLAADGGAGGVVTLAITPFPWHGREEAGRGALAAPFDGRISLDRRRARRGLYPAIDPLGSRLRGARADAASPRHQRLAEATRALLERYEALDPQLALPDPASFADGDAETAVRAQRLLRFLTQPFQTTEPFHGRPARGVALEELLGAVEVVLAGGDVPAGDGELEVGGGPH